MASECEVEDMGRVMERKRSGHLGLSREEREKLKEFRGKSREESYQGFSHLMVRNHSQNILFICPLNGKNGYRN